MGLFDLFSNDKASEAASERVNTSNVGFGQLQDNIRRGTNAATDLVNQGATNATNAIAGGVAGATTAANNGLAGATTAINNGANTAANYTAAAIAPWQKLFDQAQPGVDAYGDASGANGVEGLKRANDNFKNSGQYGTYGFTLDQGLQALERARAAGGSLASGNADTDAMKFATGLAGQTYKDYLAGLQPYFGAETSAAGGISGANTQGGNQAITAGDALGAINGASGNVLASGNIAAGDTSGAIDSSLYGGLAHIINTNYTNIGTAANANELYKGNANAAADLNAYNVSANGINTLMNAGKLAAGFF